MSHSYKAILFDFDGVIADTMSANLAAWQQAFAKYGVVVEPHDYYELEGSGPEQVARVLCRKFKLDESLAPEIAKAKDSLMTKGHTLSVYPEVPTMLQTLKERGITCALVTGASRRRIEHTLPAELAAYFSVITTSDDVQRTKPDPEPYVMTAKKLGYSSAECAVVENAPLGIASARGGGFHCFAVTTTLPESYLSQASEIFPNHAALRERLI